MGQAGNDTSWIPADKERDEIDSIDPHLRKYSADKVTADDFIKRYIDCEGQSPIIVRTSEGWLFDKATLLLSVLFLQGDPDLADKDIPHYDEPLLEKMMGNAGIQFESWLRAQLRSIGFNGPDEPVLVQYEYDILMVSEAQKTVLLVEAKYREVNPSSLTGANLVDQELLDDDSQLAQAQQQEKRLSFLLQNKGAFEEFLGPLPTWNSYEVRSYLVTKSPPLLSRYENTEILRASDFLESIAS